MQIQCIAEQRGVTQHLGLIIRGLPCPDFTNNGKAQSRLCQCVSRFGQRNAGPLADAGIVIDQALFLKNKQVLPDALAGESQILSKFAGRDRNTSLLQFGQPDQNIRLSRSIVKQGGHALSVDTL